MNVPEHSGSVEGIKSGHLSGHPNAHRSPPPRSPLRSLTDWLSGAEWQVAADCSCVPDSAKSRSAKSRSAKRPGEHFSEQNWKSVLGMSRADQTALWVPGHLLSRPEPALQMAGPAHLLFDPTRRDSRIRVSTTPVPHTGAAVVCPQWCARRWFS